MAGDIGSVVGRLFLIETLGDGTVPFIDVVGEKHKLVPVPDGKYFREAEDVVRKVRELDGIPIRTEAERTREENTTVTRSLKIRAKPGDPEYPYAVANHCARSDLPVIYRPNEPQDDSQ